MTDAHASTPAHPLSRVGRCLGERACPHRLAGYASSCLTPFRTGLSQRMPSDFCLVGPSGYKAAHIRQGSLGDCWFMAALAVVAERGDHLLKRNVLTRAVDKHGHYLFRLFIDGHWQLYSVDDYLPVHPGKPNKVRARC